MPKVRFVILSIALLAGVADLATRGAEKEFRAGSASDYAHQVSDRVSIGAKAFNTEDLTKEAFGKKTDLLRYGVLPVLVVIENKRQKTLDLRNMEVNLVGADGRHVGAIAPEDVMYQGHPSKAPSVVPSPVHLPIKKNHLESPEVVTRAFAAKMLPPGDSANGFFYFDAKSEPGDKLYVNGLRDAQSGQDILYFEFSLDQGGQ